MRELALALVALIGPTVACHAGGEAKPTTRAVSRPRDASVTPAEQRLIERAADLLGDYREGLRRVERERGEHPSHRRGMVFLSSVSVRMRVDLCRKEGIPALMRMLGDREAYVRRMGIFFLGEIGPEAKAAVPALTELLAKGYEPGIVRTLGKIGRSAAPAVPILEKMLYEEGAPRMGGEWDAIRTMCEGLAEIGKPAAPALARALHAKNETVRLFAAKNLGAMGADGKAGVKSLAQALRDKSRHVPYSAATALGQIGPAAKEALPDLMKTLKDTTGLMRVRVAEAINKIDPTATKRTVPVLIALLKDRHFLARQAAAQELGRCGPAAGKAIPALVKLLDDESPGPRKAAVLALGQLKAKPSDVVPALKKRLKDTYVDVRVAAAMVLEQLDPTTRPATIPVLVESLTDDGAFSIRRSAKLLGGMGKDAVPGLIKAFKEGKVTARIRAASALGMIGRDAASAADVLIATLTEKSSEATYSYVRRSAARALGKIGVRKGEVVPILIEMLKDRNVRAGASEALHLLDPEANKAHMDIFIKALQRGDPWSRADAARALGRIGPAAKRAIPQLMVLLYDHDDDVRSAAAEALKSIRAGPTTRPVTKPT